MQSAARRAILIRFFPKLFLSLVILLSVSFSNFSAASSITVVINEVGWMGTSASANDEWVELYNNSDSEVDLSGWGLVSADGTPKITFGSGKKISGKGYFLLERTDDDTIKEVAADQLYTGALSNDGEDLQLKDSTGNLIDRVNASSGWFAGDSSGKASMERKDFEADGNTSSNWGTNDGVTVTGKAADGNTLKATPKSQNSVYRIIYPSDIYLSEYLPYPDSGDEWVEIYNGNNESKILLNWQIDDIAGGGSSPKSFTATVAGKGFLKIDLAASFFNNDGDSVRLLRPDGTVADETSFTLSYKSNAFARDSGNNWQETTKLTPEEINVISSPVHSLTVSEIKKLVAGSRISTEAFVTAPPDLLGDNDFYIHDSAGGIKVHCTCSLSSTSFGLDQKIKISSSIEESDSEKYIKTDSVTVLEINQLQTETDSIGTGELNEANEGNLVKITGLVDHLDGTTFYLNDGSGLAKVYIKDSTGVIRPNLESGQLVRAIGVVSQSGTLKDGSANYRLLPRFQGDIEILSVTKEELVTDSSLGGQVLGAVTRLPVTGPEDDLIRFALFLLLLGLNLRLFIRRRFSDFC